jgi:UDP-GlcNAc:undecaprenyl-phosphate/decaprenyl-phosphate GlcNAc-1-phosphate transferase
MIISSILVLLLTFVSVCFAIKKILYIAHRKHLFDEPSEERKIHLTRTPNLGGLAIFTVFLFFCPLFVPANSISHLPYLIAAAVALVALGVTDDLVGVAPLKKMTVQLVVAFMATVMTGIRIESLYGFAGITTLAYPLTVACSVVFVVFMINAVNLIDGINGLAGGIGLLSCTIFSFLFWKQGDAGYYYLSLAMCGCLAGFLVYNITPASIFMGDTGSMFLGLVLAVFSIRFLSLTDAVVSVKPGMSPSVIFALLVIPVFDTVRVFAVRLWKKKPPFVADRSHVHHLLLNIGLSHLQATAVLLTVNVSVLLLAYSAGSLKMEYNMLLMSVYMIGLYITLWYVTQHVARKRARTKAQAATTRVPRFTYIINKGAITVKNERGSLVEENSN